MHFIFADFAASVPFKESSNAKQLDGGTPSFDAAVN